MADDFRDRYDILDTVTPRHAMLAGRYKKSFAYIVLRDRMPVALTQIIDNLLKDKDEIARRFGENQTRRCGTNSLMHYPKNSTAFFGLVGYIRNAISTERCLRFLRPEHP
uniref:Uncharacterized protein n=1 Tax=Glossina pallidipes TaxID=7398 RepID=A0A1A9Z7P2_GLOPL